MIEHNLISSSWVDRRTNQSSNHTLSMNAIKSLPALGVITSAILSVPLFAPLPANALPAGVPPARCGTIANPQPGTLCYSVTPGGGKVTAGGNGRTFPEIIIQATEPEYVIADVILEITSDAGNRDLPSVRQLSPGGQASIVSVATEKLRELKRITAELRSKVTVFTGPALIEAQSKLTALQEEEERNYENVVTTTISAGQDAGKFVVAGGSARSRKCGFANLDTCGSWVEYNVYAVKRYVGNPIAAYNRAFAVAQDAQNTVARLEQKEKERIASIQAERKALSSQLPPGTDLGYDDLPRGLVDVNGDSILDYCRFVEDAPTIFIACMLGTKGGFDVNSQLTAFTSARGINQGYPDRPRGFRDVNGDGKTDYCRFDGPPGKIQDTVTQHFPRDLMMIQSVF